MTKEQFIGECQDSINYYKAQITLLCQDNVVDLDLLQYYRSELSMYVNSLERAKLN